MSFAFAQFLLLIPVVFINFKYYRMGFKTLFHGSPNMDSLIAIGSSAAIVYGIYAIYKIGIGFGHGDMATVHSFMMDLYFESAGMILTLITLGKTLEARAKGKTSDAIVAEAEKERISFLQVSDFEQIPGQGIVGKIGNEICYAGNRRLLQANGISGGALLQLGESMAVDGKTPLFFARGGQLIGVIAVADVVKPTSRQAVQELSAMGIEVVMLTGDNAKTAEAIRRQVDVDRVVAEVFPQDKEKEIRRLQDSSKKVAMVGDGINDAPALARADVGIAIGAGTDVAIESADIVLMKNDLLDVFTAIQLSKAVIRNIKQNLFWAFIYNIIGIPVAAGLFYLPFDLKLNPMIGAFAMSFSSVFVVSNALRLRCFKAKHTSHAEPDADRVYEQATIINEKCEVKKMKSGKWICIAAVLVIIGMIGKKLFKKNERNAG